MKPIWIPHPLEVAFKNTVVQAFTSPYIYHPELAPLPWLISLYGRPGMDKLEVMEKLCLMHGLYGHYKSVVVKMGETSKAMNEIRCIAEATTSVLQEDEEVKKDKPYFIILIDHVDILCYEPDTEKCLLDSIEMEQLCKDNKVLIVGIFDRLPGETQPHTSPWIRECHNRFFAQFTTLLYIEAPNAPFRVQLFKFYISEFESHYNKTHGVQKIKVKLQEGDYERLSDFSTFSTPQNILFFMRKVFLNILQASAEDEVIAEGLGVNYIEKFTNTQFGAPHICTYDARDDDNRFATACGRGPAPKPKNTPPPPCSTDAVTHVTGFTEENADLEHVMDVLKEEEQEEPIQKKIKV